MVRLVRYRDKEVDIAIKCRAQPASYYRNCANPKSGTKSLKQTSSRMYIRPIGTTHQATCTGKYHKIWQRLVQVAAAQGSKQMPSAVITAQT